jgi:hypothetical protein
MKKIPLFETEEAVPKELGALAFSRIDSYGDPRLGVGFRYDRGITKADAYLYNLGLEQISDDIRSEQVLQFFRDACGEILLLAERGLYLDCETRTSQYLHLPDDNPDPMFLWAAFRYRQAPGPGVLDEDFRFSHIFVRTDRGYINKIRYTYPDRVKKDAAQDMIQFLIEWHAAIPRI